MTGWLSQATLVSIGPSGPNKDAVMRVHERAGHPTPEVYEIPVEVA